jgi:hypothetical protein
VRAKYVSTESSKMTVRNENPNIDVARTVLTPARPWRETLSG